MKSNSKTKEESLMYDSLSSLYSPHDQACVSDLSPQQLLVRRHQSPPLQRRYVDDFHLSDRQPTARCTDKQNFATHMICDQVTNTK